MPEILQCYQQVLKGRFDFYDQLHKMLVKEKLAVLLLVRESNAFGYLINLLGLFWHQETAVYFPHYTDDQKLKHSLSVVFQIYKPYLTKRYGIVETLFYQAGSLLIASRLTSSFRFFRFSELR